jgi:hypothetical protein
MADPRPKAAALTTDSPAVDAASRLIPLPAFVSPAHEPVLTSSRFKSTHVNELQVNSLKKLARSIAQTQ